MRKLICLILTLSYCGVFAQNGKVHFTLISNHEEKQYFESKITITNTTKETFKNWMFAFTFVRPIQKLEGMEMVYPAVGDFNLVKPTTPVDLEPGDTYTFFVKGQFWVKHLTDAPAGYFIVKENGDYVPCEASAELPSWEQEDLYDELQEYNKFPVEGNDPNKIPTPSVGIVPAPAEATMCEGEFELQNHMPIVYEPGNKKAKRAAHLLQQELECTGYEFPIKSTDCGCGTYHFVVESANDNEIGKEGYYLQVQEKRILLRANHSAGFFYGVQSLKQLLGPQVFVEGPHMKVKKWSVPRVSIKDYPRFEYRGLLLDSSRHFFQVNEVKRLIDLMALHKLNRLHWHLTDDEGWRIAIDQYPQLTAIGSVRGWKLPLPPALGSGPAPYAGFYSKDEIKDIVAYAAKCHIEIIPEIDLPAHARALVKSFGPKESNPLVDPNDQSKYVSVQGYTDDVICPCKMSVYEVLSNIFDEVAEMFPGSYISVGGDEQPSGAWRESPLCGYDGSTPLSDQKIQEIQRNFFKNMEKILANLHKGKSKRKMAGWENILDGNPKLDKKDTLVFAWTGKGEEGYKAAKAGYNVVMAPAQFLYFDLTYSDNPYEPGNYWAGNVNTFSAYKFSPIPYKMNAGVAKRIKGVEGTLWSEMLFDFDRLQYMAFPKVAALSEVAWTPKERRNWKEFSSRVGRCYLPILDALQVTYRVPPPGISKQEDLKANREFPYGHLRFTLDGKDPIQESNPYPPPFQVPAKKAIMRAFSIDGKRPSKVASRYPGVEVPVCTEEDVVRN